MLYKPLEYSSEEEDDEKKVHYDKKSLPKTIDRGDATSPSMVSFTPIRIIHAGRFSQCMVVRTLDTFSHDVLCLKHLMRRKKEAVVAFENELSVYRHSDAHPSLFPHILPLIDFHRSVDVSFIVTELGGPNLNILRSNIIQREFSLDSALRLSIQALEGIRSLHRAGILHLSIQPANMIIGLGANSCNLYLVGFTGMKKVDTKQKRSLIHAPHPLFAPGKMKKEPSMLDDLEGWLYSTIDLMARRQLDWMQKKWSHKYREKEFNELSEAKKNLFTDEKFDKLANVPEFMKELGRLIQSSEAADFESHHDKIVDTFKKYLTEHELDMYAVYEWESTSFQKTIHQLMLGKHEKDFVGPYYTKLQERPPKKTKEEKKGNFENSDEELDQEEKKEEEKIKQMQKVMKKLVEDILKGPMETPEDEEESVKE
uniref:Protein kinase domain-containing protein n=1 Tax=Pristionchus pacificus TaxID=54126 RepID=A0A2A6BWL0_PRIPA|eukprot:PDM70151.1 protein kinase [Pristionchus pacificus]